MATWPAICSSRLPATTPNAIRFYTPMTKSEEEEEKARVASLTPFQKDQELRKLNRQISKLQMLRGINTGELYTWIGQYKHLAREYGTPLMAWYFCCWLTTGVGCYAIMEVGGLDAMQFIQQVDGWMGWNLASRVSPDIGKVGLVLVMNELIEPLRLPVVILTIKPVVDRLFPPKY